jgi:hypothetical protein
VTIARSYPFDKRLLPDGHLQTRWMMEWGGPGFETAMFCFDGGVFSVRQTELSLLLSLREDCGHACAGGALRRQIAVRMARIIGLMSSTSASWKVKARA